MCNRRGSRDLGRGEAGLLRIAAAPRRRPEKPSRTGQPDTRQTYTAFDILAVAGHDARNLPLHQRRALLEELAKGWKPPLSLSPTTTDPDEVARWFDELPDTGVEGLVINVGP